MFPTPVAFQWFSDGLFARLDPRIYNPSVNRRPSRVLIVWRSQQRGENGWPCLRKTPAVPIRGDPTSEAATYGSRGLGEKRHSANKRHETSLSKCKDFYQPEQAAQNLTSRRSEGPSLAMQPAGRSAVQQHLSLPVSQRRPLERDIRLRRPTCPTC